jgi:AmmeMemoRadiSam system protein B/AmmeMemoRadiSam system protein A
MTLSRGGPGRWLMLTLLLAVTGACAARQPGPAAQATATASPTLMASSSTIAVPPAQATSTRPSPSAASPTTPSGRIRPAELAGSWYPEDPRELAQTVDEMLAAVKPVDGVPIALIAPHAGHVYSGPVAAYAFRQLQGKGYDVAVIVAPDHQAPVSRPISVWGEGAFETPLGAAPVNAQLAQALLAADARITFDSAAFEGENTIEVELPFLQRACPACSIVPVLMGDDDEQTVSILADALLAVLPGRRVVVIASSDLSHYPKREDAEKVDKETLAAIATGDPARVRETLATQMKAGIPNLLTCACGEGPILVAMRVARGLGADTTTVLRYANSADFPQGDPQQVVGYGAVMFWQSGPVGLTEAQQSELLALARKTLAEYLGTGHILDYTTTDPALNRPSGAFVTLREGNELRGCIGRIVADTPLYRVVQEMAVAAATSDPRFPQLRKEELSQVEIEISALSAMQPLTNVQQIQVGTHGLLVQKEGRQGIFLPQVPVEQGWDRDQYLENLCQKAWLPVGCWQEGASLYTFTAVVFGE